ncbi:MAG: class I SAM-dependent methyltransferase [Bacteroidota bacterium]
MMSTNWRWKAAQFSERRWWRSYLAKKDKRQYLSDKRAYWQRVLRTLHYQPKARDRALELGCGPAGIFVLLHNTQTITAIDPLIEAYSEDLPHFNEGMYPDVRFEQATMESYRVAEKFDVIYAFNTINHVADWGRALQNIDVLVRPGGTILLSSDVHRFSVLRSIFQILPGDILHPQQHSRAHYIEAFYNLGWRVDREEKLKRQAIFDYYAWVLKKA